MAAVDELSSGKSSLMDFADRQKIRDAITTVVRRRQISLDEMQLVDPHFDEAYRIWTANRSKGLVPTLDEDMQAAIVRIVKSTHIIDVSENEPHTWTFKTIAFLTQVSWEWSSRYRTLGDCPWPAIRKMLIEDYNAVRFSGSPTYHEVTAPAEGVTYRYRRLVLPIADDGRTVDTLLVCINLTDGVGFEA